MGIHNLIKYLKSYDHLQLFQCETGDKIYVSNIVYYDITYKLIEIYNTFMKANKTESYEKKVEELLRYMEKELSFILSKLSVMNRLVYIFVDYKFMNGLNEGNILFEDFLDYEVEGDEKGGSGNVMKMIPMIKRKFVAELDKLDCGGNERDGANEVEEKINYLRSKVRCMFELKTIYSMADNLNIEKYVSIPYLIKEEKMKTQSSPYSQQTQTQSSPYSQQTQTQSTQQTQTNKLRCLTTLLNEGRLRYLILRGAKYQTRKHRSKSLFSFLDKDCENLDKQIQKCIENGNQDKLTHFLNYIPFTLIIYSFPKIIENLKFDNVKFLGCEVESDYAISKHIHTYSKNAFPTVYSSDTDMLVHMCDVSCVVKLSFKVSETKRLSYYINPVMFWKEIFGCDLSKRLIKIICVLKGTDYNPYCSTSPIHIKNFKDVLKWMNVDSFEKVDEDLLLAKIYMIMRKNEGNVYCRQTALALNMYLNNFECDIHFISGGCRSCCREGGEGESANVSERVNVSESEEEEKGIVNGGKIINVKRFLKCSNMNVMGLC